MKQKFITCEKMLETNSANILHIQNLSNLSNVKNVINTTFIKEKCNF